jgi:chemotaxis signal transduction protein
MDAEILIFEVNCQRHGLPAAQVEELLRAQAIVPVAGAREPLEGIINLRGEVIPVLNMRRCLGAPAEADRGPTALSGHFIVVRAANRLLALHVDHAIELIHVNDAAFADAGASSHGPAIRVAKLESGLVLLHRADDFLAAAALAPQGGRS